MEDSAYLQSTQYRHFTFTPAVLSQIRSSTNTVATQRLHDSIQSAVQAGDLTPPSDGSSSATSNTSSTAALTAREELKLVSYYLTTCVQLCDHFRTGSAVKATCVAYLQRIYLRISPLQIHPKTLLLPILFLAYKAEQGIQSTSWFIRTAEAVGLSITKEELLQPEIDIAMNLRWSFQVLHPFRSVEGLKAELLSIASGLYRSPAATGGPEGPPLQKSFEKIGGTRERSERACARARSLLTGTALLTDVYFLYPPPQIALAAVWAHDAELVEFFLRVKFGSDAVRPKLLKVIRECAECHLMATKDSPATYPGLLLRLPQNGVPLSPAEISPDLKKEVGLHTHTPHPPPLAALT